jgi:uncharacterized membrane protein YfbV (UPF0208 family)
MIKITPEELVRYLYNETSEQKTAALQTDWNLRETFEKLQTAQQSLKGVNLSPRPQAVNKILEYASKKHEEVHSH